MRQGLSYFVKFDEISTTFRIGLQVHNMKSVTLIPRQSSMHSENNYKCIVPKFHQIKQTNVNPKAWIYHKNMSLPKLSKRTIQDSIQ